MLQRRASSGIRIEHDQRHRDQHERQKALGGEHAACTREGDNRQEQNRCETKSPRRRIEQSCLQRQGVRKSDAESSFLRAIARSRSGLCSFPEESAKTLPKRSLL